MTSCCSRWTASAQGTGVPAESVSGPPERLVPLKDLAALPGNRFEALKGDRKGQYSIRINDQWRICFEWPEKSPGPTNVEIVDYH